MAGEFIKVHHRFGKVFIRIVRDGEALVIRMDGKEAERFGERVVKAARSAVPRLKLREVN